MNSRHESLDRPKEEVLIFGLKLEVGEYGGMGLSLEISGVQLVGAQSWGIRSSSA